MDTNFFNKKILLKKQLFGPCSIETFLKYKLSKEKKTNHDQIHYEINEIRIENPRIKYIAEVSYIYLDINCNLDKCNKNILIQKYLMCISKDKKKIYKKFINSDVDGNSFISNSRVYITEPDIDEDEYYMKMNLKYDILEKNRLFHVCSPYGYTDYTDDKVEDLENTDNKKLLNKIISKNKNSKFKIFKPSFLTLSNIKKTNNNQSEKNTKYRPPTNVNSEKYSLVIKNIPTYLEAVDVENRLKHLFFNNKDSVNIKVLKTNYSNGNKGIAFVDFLNINTYQEIIKSNKKYTIDNMIISIELKKKSKY